MALAFLLFVFFVVIVMIALFVFPLTNWVRWFYNLEDNQSGQSATTPPATPEPGTPKPPGDGSGAASDSGKRPS